jgi:hypothetical protein
MSLVRSSQPGVNPRYAVDFAVPYFISSICLSLALTILIAARLLYLRRQMSPGAPSATYFSLASLLVESSLLQSFCGVGTIAGLAVDNASAAFLIIILGQVTVSPDGMIYYAVTRPKLIQMLSSCPPCPLGIVLTSATATIVHQPDDDPPTSGMGQRLPAYS